MTLFAPPEPVAFPPAPWPAPSPPLAPIDPALPLTTNTHSFLTLRLIWLAPDKVVAFCIAVLGDSSLTVNMRGKSVRMSCRLLALLGERNEGMCREEVEVLIEMGEVKTMDSLARRSWFLPLSATRVQSPLLEAVQADGGPGTPEKRGEGERTIC